MTVAYSLRLPYPYTEHSNIDATAKFAPFGRETHMLQQGQRPLYVSP